MNTVEELKKIVTILEQKKFSYKGGVYELNVEATENTPINSNLANKPLMKFIGSDGGGNTVMVWSHDCTVVGDDPLITAPIEVYVIEVEHRKNNRTKNKKKR